MGYAHRVNEPWSKNRYQYKICNAGPELSQLIQALVTANQYTNFHRHYHRAEANISAMALSVEAIVAIVGVIVSVLVALPSVARILVKRNNNPQLGRRGMAVFLRQVEEEVLSN